VFKHGFSSGFIGLDEVDSVTSLPVMDRMRRQRRACSGHESCRNRLAEDKARMRMTRWRSTASSAVTEGGWGRGPRRRVVDPWREEEDDHLLSP
jgi:hypothetical protein